MSHDVPQGSVERFLRMPEVEQRTGLRKSALYQAIKEQRFPPGVRLTARSIAWTESSINAWISARIAASKVSA